MLTKKLVQNVCNTPLESIPDTLIEHAKKSLLNWLGVTLGAINHETVNVLLRATNEITSQSEATILGRREKKDISSAVLVNGTASHIFDYDDTHLDTIHHPSGPVAPIVFTLGEAYDIKPAILLRAFILGCEVELRISNAIYPFHYQNGFHITSSTGVFGAAIASGVIFDLTEEEMEMALGVAGTQAFGLREVFGTMTKPFHPGKAAQNGLLASLLVKNGFTSSKEILEAKRGFLNVYSTNSSPDKILKDWGNKWEFFKNSFKPYACGIVLHPSIDACIKLREFVNPEEVEEISLAVHPYVLELTGKENPQTGLEGKFSIYHTAAISFLEHDASEKQFKDEKVNAPRIVAFRNKISPYIDEKIAKDKVYAILKKKDGAIHKVFIDNVTGSLQKPMSQRQINHKFTNLSDSLLNQHQITQIIKKIMRFEELNTIKEVLKYLRYE